ncbi:hypothetical protein [Ramlibacter alkalitolerans]|uniref:Uncharacterized protein n=1 Tax=Ramlibacter alkalitolerans TaxID=2039631 RepID=A0ABS1JME0_9BURK|nr:hypothetical protein [Ramlibacter alkalitolerans]MBL0425373.1 hypothetical protein [Ramlibacter alkalitolerans]
MAIATAPAGPPTGLELLRARAWLLPWMVLAIVVGSGIAGAQRGSTRPLEQPGRVAVNSPPEQAAVHCEPRRGFALRLAFTAQLMARSLVRGSQHADHAPGATCQVQRP